MYGHSDELYAATCQDLKAERSRHVTCVVFEVTFQNHCLPGFRMQPGEEDRVLRYLKTLPQRLLVRFLLCVRGQSEVWHTVAGDLQIAVFEHTPKEITKHIFSYITSKRDWFTLFQCSKSFNAVARESFNPFTDQLAWRHTLRNGSLTCAMYLASHPNFVWTDLKSDAAILMERSALAGVLMNHPVLHWLPDWMVWYIICHRSPRSDPSASNKEVLKEAINSPFFSGTLPEIPLSIRPFWAFELAAYVYQDRFWNEQTMVMLLNIVGREAFPWYLGRNAFCAYVDAIWDISQLTDSVIKEYALGDGPRSGACNVPLSRLCQVSSIPHSSLFDILFSWPCPIDWTEELLDRCAKFDLDTFWKLLDSTLLQPQQYSSLWNRCSWTNPDLLAMFLEHPTALSLDDILYRGYSRVSPHPRLYDAYLALSERLQSPNLILERFLLSLSATVDSKFGAKLKTSPYPNTVLTDFLDLDHTTVRAHLSQLAVFFDLYAEKLWDDPIHDTALLSFEARDQELFLACVLWLDPVSIIIAIEKDLFLDVLFDGASQAPIVKHIKNYKLEAFARSDICMSHLLGKRGSAIPYSDTDLHLALQWLIQQNDEDMLANFVQRRPRALGLLCTGPAEHFLIAKALARRRKDGTIVVHPGCCINVKNHFAAEMSRDANVDYLNRAPFRLCDRAHLAKKPRY